MGKQRIGEDYIKSSFMIPAPNQTPIRVNKGKIYDHCM